MIINAALNDFSDWPITVFTIESIVYFVFNIFLWFLWTGQKHEAMPQNFNIV